MDGSVMNTYVPAATCVSTAGRLAAPAAQPVQQQDHVQTVKFESPLRRVGGAERAIEVRLAGLASRGFV